MYKFHPIGTIDLSKKIHIYGAGIAGLLIGYYLKKRNADFVIYEKASIAGGKIQTKTCEYGIVETAANAVYTSDTILELLKDLKIQTVHPTPNLKKKIWINNKAKSKFVCPFSFIKFLKNSLQKIKLEKNFDQYSVKEFLLPVFGEKFINQVISPAFRGIYAIEADELHLKSIFPEPKINQRYFSYFFHLIRQRKKISKTRAISISFKNGMGDLISKLKTHLQENIELNSNKELLNNSIICTSAQAASELFSSNQYGINNLLKK